MGKRWDNFIKAWTPPKVHRPSVQELYGGPRAFSGYQPAGATAGAGALANLEQVARNGWTNTDQAAFGQMQRQANQGEAAQRSAITQQAAARGQLTGGNAFTAALAAEQGGADRAAQSGAEHAAQGAERRLGASQAAGQLQQQQATATDNFNQWASQMQADAVKQRYESEKENKNSWWHRMSGGFM